ncbi:MAG: hypothetical protein M1814_002376 [Vezdaea aestivalis]|nr:MAG: hypothetical protein M1814_002376 [Vezdaea aestivalis]
MASYRTVAAASAALAVLASTASAAITPGFEGLMRRTGYPAQPPCTYPFTDFDYVGCYVEGSSARTLPFSPQLDFNTMTPQKCVASCKANGFRYAGLEYYGQCFCGASVGGILAADPTECKLACTGDKNKTCGGNDRLSIYSDPTFPIVDSTSISDYKPLGCYSEGIGGRSLAFPMNSVFGDGLTNEKCLGACKAAGYPLAGTEFGRECYCGVVFGNGTLPALPSDCNFPCAGTPNDNIKTCGGRARLNVYQAWDLMSSKPCGPDVQPPPVSTATSTGTTATSTSTSTSDSSSSTPSTTASSTASTTPSTTPSTTASDPSSTAPSSTQPSTTPSSTAPSSTMPSTTPSFTIPSTTKPSTTASVCVVTATVTPTCEYKIGNWCARPIPYFKDSASCKDAAMDCYLQVAPCFSTLGWPQGMQCFDLLKRCAAYKSYCFGWGSGSSKSGCDKQNPVPASCKPPPPPPPPVNTCTAAPTTSTKTPTVTCPPVPTKTDVCIDPKGPPGSGYEGDECVGGVRPPPIGCNKGPDSGQNPFKLYYDQDYNRCKSYKRPDVPNACQDACKVQYYNCVNVYAESCGGNKKRNSRRDDKDSATKKCQAQYWDCYKANKDTPATGC